MKLNTLKSFKNIHESLKEHFGFDGFKGNQEEVIKSLLDGNNTFVIMPTGGGKSLCYQLPGLVCEGTAIVISPLISLMKNQVDSIRAIRGIDTEKGIAHFLNSSLSKSEIKQVKKDVQTGKTKLLYVAPESLTREENINLLREVKVSFYAVDEAHCISEWGHDFRVEYRRIRPIVNEIGHNVPIIALTATATPKVQHDILKNLEITDAKVFISSFNRPNLYYEVRHKTNNLMKDIIKFIKQHSGKSGIIYCLSRKRVEEVAETLNVNGIKALPYHAGLDSKIRVRNQDMFLMEEVDVIVATIAFGMGIDKPDIRYIIHYDMPKSLEGYYQETGRSGRDDGEGICLGFYDYEDMLKLEKLAKNKPVSEQEITKQLLTEVMAYAETSVCRRKFLLHYFGEKYEKDNCEMCDNCIHPKTKFDGQEYVELVLEAVEACKQLVKDKHLINVIIGKVNQQVKQYKHNKLDVFGRGADKDERFWMSVIRQVLILRLLTKDIENYGVLKLTPEGKAFLKNPKPITLIMEEAPDKEDDEEVFIEGAKTGATDPVLFSMLKSLRKEIAKKENLPPFVIFQDASLEDMAIQYPISIEELKNITGVGEGKALRYGSEFVKLIAKYVEENEIERPKDLVVKSSPHRSGLKVYIIQNIDRKVAIDEIAYSKGLTIDEILTEIESIVASGIKIDLDYFINEEIDGDKQQEIINYFTTAESDSVEKALEVLGEEDYDINEIRLMRIKFMSEYGN